MKQTPGPLSLILFSLTYLLSLVASVAAQETQRDKPSLVTVSGKIRDKLSNEPIPFVPVTLVFLHDSTLITGALSDEKGNFQIENIRTGNWKLKVECIGYHTYIRDTLSIAPKPVLASLGVITLNPSGKELATVNISGAHSDFQLGIDKKIFMVDNDLGSKGGTATDVLKNIPIVSVDIDGNITIRGTGNITVLIDGHPSGMIASNRAAIFDQIPASSIERIEIITNPSAKYDPDGVSGIINIVLKKNNSQGFSLVATAGYSTFRKGNSGISVGYRKGKLNVYGNYNYRYSEKWYNGYTNRTTTQLPVPFTTDQTSQGIRRIQTHIAKLGIDYAISPQSTLSVTGTYNLDLDKDLDSVGYRFLDMSNRLTSYSLRNMHGVDLDRGYDGLIAYQRTFDRPGKIFSLEGSVSGNINEVNDSIGQMDYSPTNVPLDAYPLIQRIQDLSLVTNYYVKTDFVQPVGESGKLETGLKYSLRKNSNDFHSFNFNSPISSWQEDTGISNLFIFNQQIYSGYAMWSQKIRRMAYQLGGRLEEDIRDSRLARTNTNYHQENLNFFPSATLSYRPNDEQEVHLAYSRRINRPGLRNLNPFPDYTDPRNLHFGNPYLNPEYIDAVELAWVRYYKKGSVSAAIYYRHTTGVIQLYRSLIDSITTSSTYKNLNTSDVFGAEITAKKEVFSWWNLMANVNAYQLTIDGSNVDPSLKNSGFTWFAKGRTAFNFTKKLSAQVYLNYYAPAPTSQGTILIQWNCDAALHLDFLSGRGGLSLGVNDLFNSLSTRVNSTTPDFYQTFYKKRESRMATLTLSFRFGSADPFRKHKALVEEEVAPPQREVE